MTPEKHHGHIAIYPKRSNWVPANQKLPLHVRFVLVITHEIWKTNFVHYQKNPILKVTAIRTLPFCLVAGMAATVITFSQTPEPAKTEIPTMTLPAENVELIDVQGRKIIGTVLSMAADRLSIAVRTAVGKEMPLSSNLMLRRDSMPA